MPWDHRPISRKRRCHAACASAARLSLSGRDGPYLLVYDPAQFPQSGQAPKGAPNALLLVIDACGFDTGPSGGVPSPTMEKLASEELRFNRFHTAPCGPTRAALISGLNLTFPLREPLRFDVPRRV